jgi:hypothetical protein
MIDIQIRIVWLIGIHLGLLELLDSKRKCQNKWHPSKIIGLIGIYLGLLELLASKQECQNDRHPSNDCRIDWYPFEITIISGF